MDFLLILICFVLLIFLAYFYIRQKFSFWSSQGINGPPPSILSFGNAAQFYSQNPFKPELECFRKYGKVYGSYLGLRPVLNIADPELVKQIAVKDFHLFIGHIEHHTHHELVDRIVFIEESPKDWKRIRTITSPCFSSAKLRAMYAKMDHSVDQLIGYFDNVIQNEDGLVKDTRKVMIGFGLDVIASNVFGLQTDSNSKDSRSSANPFLTNAIKIFEASPLTMLGVLTFPLWLNNLLSINHFFNVEGWNFFEKLAKEILRKRRTNESGKRNDLIDILIDAQVDEAVLDGDNYNKLAVNLEEEEENGEFRGFIQIINFIQIPDQAASKVLSSLGKTSKLTLSENEIVAQAIGFMIGGYDTTAATLTHCIYEFTRNPDVQERLHRELETALAQIEPNSSEYYETLNAVPYLDAVLKETMRKYPPLTRIFRRLDAKTKDYKLGNTGIVIQGGQGIEFSVLALHHNPEYFPEPDRFNPDRFMPENKHRLVPYSFLPFGHGPRNCLGQRFGTQELKICLAKICRKYRFAQTDKTPKAPLEFVPYKIVLSSVQVEVKVAKR